MFYVICVIFFFKQKTAYEMRISDWSSDVCSSDLAAADLGGDCGHRDRTALVHRARLDRHPSDGHHRDRHRFFGGFHRRRDRGVMRMGDDLELPAKNTLFLAVTRPALWAGIPIEAAVLLLITSASVLIESNSPIYAALVVAFGYSISRLIVRDRKSTRLNSSH